MIKLSPALRSRLLAHLAGEQPVKATELRNIGALKTRGLIKTLPPHQPRPHKSAFTRAGRALALQLQAEG